LKQLPINFDGIVMQEDEEYGNLVWDKHFGSNYAIYKNQKKLYQLSGLLNPFASLQSLSMGLCGNDMVHHLDFLEKAEKYRRYLIKELNDKHAFGGSKTGNWKWTVDETFFKSVEGFNYRSPSIFEQMVHYMRDIFFLMTWMVITTMLLRFNINKNNLL
jgi:ABC-2 type transport system permease protein